MTEPQIALGRLVNVHATRGELRFLPYNPDSDALRPGLRVLLRRGGEQVEAEIVALRPHKRVLLLTLAGCDSMTAAEKLVGMELVVSASALPPVAENEVYHYELVGMRVEDESGSAIGTVAEVLPLPSADICVVHSREGREHLVPMNAEFIRRIDREHRLLVIHPIPGLLDL